MRRFVHRTGPISICQDVPPYGFKSRSPSLRSTACPPSSSCWFRMAYEISDDMTTDLDVIHYHKLYACRGTPTHVFRMLLSRRYNDDERWKEFDRKVFGYDTEDDIPD